MEVERISVGEFHNRCRDQGVSSHIHVAFICPACETVQSAANLIQVGAGKDFDGVERFVGWSCVGRWTDAKGPRRRPDGKPCDWTLGGLFKIHSLEVVPENGKGMPRFQLATAEQAQALEKRNTAHD